MKNQDLKSNRGLSEINQVKIYEIPTEMLAIAKVYEVVTEIVIVK